ncbi:hypothetical protein WN944_024050 [Citrus x changshan-huyou]|uniref:non-specific serine/threonine protein kinase n=1 Tax=Citrus x changshan-huyou TaxID=2935761 RepID=A0AAP0LN67_9ROSI
METTRNRGMQLHKKLVGLIGYCADGAQRMLVYEYVHNGNLEQWLHGDVGSVSPLTWDIRMKIAIGTAKGLACLHEGLEPKFVHRDVKSSNILLDRKWNPKVSDFGLAKLLGSEASYKLWERYLNCMGAAWRDTTGSKTRSNREKIWSSVEKDAKAMRLPPEDLPFGKKKLFPLVNATVRKKLFVPGLEVPTADIKFFPEANEVKFARKSLFEGASFKLDYLTKPSFFEDFGFTEKVKMADRVKPEDELFLVAYPYFNVNEMLVVEELYKEAVFNTARKLIIFNGELDRIRCYPGSWKVLKKVSNKYICLHHQEVMPSLKEVALDILPSA